ncbi:hypothetical protein QBC46DRAFT_365608 [Diplogelasinospora grovesii]|uniref:Uncharacterized protein n=1 Tax=Diplogelasinospora grovesii TaxID=303347 RepID=A0AAN6S2M7_9PEZI|nr:hypothetical protein QBC46DRAFT_365608 [Diplogelasinospora grovesii]
MESYAYIKEAGWTLQIKMRPSLHRFKKLQESMPFNLNTVTEKSDNQLIMPYPNINLARDLGFDDNLYLRKTLNQIHQMLYNPDNPSPLKTPAGTPTENIIECIQNSLDIRYVITHRPFIRQILEFNHKAKLKSFESPLPTYSKFRSDVTVPAISADARTPGDIPQQVIKYAVISIRALIKSIRAFHKVEDKRFIITNGNLLTLTAAFKDPILSAYINKNTLKELFSRTITFFKLIAQPTNALVIDMHILEGLKRELWRDIAEPGRR